jgi:glycosyltransferase involved in cell wall biosynthesis
MMENKQLRVCVIGAGTRFLSGISYYTLYLANALAPWHKISVILMRQLLPVRLYPGRKRVGMNLTQHEFDPMVRVFNGVDWYWLPSMLRALLFLVQERPDVMVFQWWSGSVLHSFLLLAVVGRLLKARVIVEFHEVLDTGEAKLRPVAAYVRVVAPLLMRLAHGFVIHSEYDRKLLQRQYNLEKRSTALIPHGPYSHYHVTDGERGYRTAPASSCNLLFFGVIRPFKGLEDLIMAFDALPEDVIEKYWLTIVGETWEGWTEPTDLIERSRHRDRITFVNRYVSDEEVAQFFSGADVVVLPYHRSSTSGPLHIAMSCGLPVVVTSVGGLIEAVSSYEGAILVPPADPASLQRALLGVAKLCGKRYADSHSWQQTAKRYQTLVDAIRCSSDSPVQVDE